MFVRMYNNFTGSSVTHRDVENWGFLEVETIVHAIDLLSGGK